MSRKETLSQEYEQWHQVVDDEWKTFYQMLTKHEWETIEPFVKGPEILELGTADGRITERLAETGARVTAVDGCKEFLKDVERRLRGNEAADVELHHRMFDDFLENPPFIPPRKFTTVVAMHVIEHLEDPVEFMAKIRRDMLDRAEDSRLIIIVPNALSLNRLAGVELGHIDSPYHLNETDKRVGHVRVYDWHSLQTDIRQAGFHMRHSGGILLKPLSAKQMEQHWSPHLMEAYFQLGKSFPLHCSELWAVCTV